MTHVKHVAHDQDLLVSEMTRKEQRMLRKMQCMISYHTIRIPVYSGAYSTHAQRVRDLKENIQQLQNKVLERSQREKS